MAGSSFCQSLLAGCLLNADKPCLLSPVFPTLLYGDIPAQISRMTQFFTELGLQKGDRVLVQAQKSPTVMLVYLSCLHSGLIYVPVNADYTDGEIAWFLDNARPALIIVDPGREPVLSALGADLGVRHCLNLGSSGIGSFSAYAAEFYPDDLPVTDCTPDDIAVLIYTSGTTGKPKGAKLSHRNLEANARTLSAFWGWQHHDVLIHALPIFHVHGLFVALHLALMNGSTMHFLPGFDARTVIGLLPESTVLMGVPTFYTRLLKDSALTPEQCRHMRLFISGSAPLLPATFKDFAQRTGHYILERYGMSETGMLTSNPLEGERVPGTVGFALPDVETRICNTEGEEVLAGETGMLEVKGPNVFKGYWQMPEKTAESFHDDYFITGDLVTAEPDARLSIVGRGRDLVITGGLNVYPREVEDAINALPGVLESAVIGVPHPDFGEGLVALVVPEPGVVLDSETLLNAIKIRLSSYKIPKKLLIVDKLPRNTMGKVQKAVLRELHARLFTSPKS